MLPAVLAVLALVGAALQPAASALAIMTSSATATANTVSTSTAFPRCYGDAVLTDNPVGYWRLDETSGTVAADSKGSNPGTYVNGPALGQSGALPDAVNNRAPSFDGVNDRIDVPASASLNVTSQITVEAWIYPTDTASVHPIVEYGGSASYGVHLWTYDAGTKLFANLLDTSGVGHPVMSAPVFTTGTWYHVAVTYDGNAAILYVNGSEVGRATFGAVTLKTNLPLNIGRRPVVGDPLQDAVFAGKLDEVAVYSTALTATQLRSHYNTGRCYKDAVLGDSPLGYWRLGESSGTTAGDGVAGRHGTYAGTPSLGQPGALNLNTNTAATFNGSTQYVRVPYAGALNPSSAFTVEAWAKVTSGSGTYRTVASSWRSDSRGFGIWAGPNETWEAWVSAGGSDIIAQAPITYGVWTHLVLTYNGSTAQLYVNGLLASSMAGSYAVNPSVPLAIGAGTYDGSTWQQYFPGSLDEVAIYGTALSSARIQTHYLIGRSYKDTVLDSRPAAYWRLGDSSGTTAAEVTGANPGTYENGVSLGGAGPLAGDADAAATFDGSDDDVLGPNLFGYPGTAAFSVDFWLNPSTAFQNAWRPIVSKQNGTQSSRDGWAVWLGPANDATYGNRIAFDRWTGATQHFLSGAVVIPVGTWHHVAVTYDGTTMTIYVDGTADSSRTSSLSTNSHSAPLRMASDSAVPDRYGGMLDDVAVYGRALPAGEVKLHYDSGRQ